MINAEPETGTRQPGHVGGPDQHIRSVGRVEIGDGDVAPALILLERTRCQVLQVRPAAWRRVQHHVEEDCSGVVTAPWPGLHRGLDPLRLQRQRAPAAADPDQQSSPARRPTASSPMGAPTSPATRADQRHPGDTPRSRGRQHRLAHDPDDQRLRHHRRGRCRVPGTKVEPPRTRAGHAQAGRRALPRRRDHRGRGSLSRSLNRRLAAATLRRLRRSSPACPAGGAARPRSPSAAQVYIDCPGRAASPSRASAPDGSTSTASTVVFNSTLPDGRGLVDAQATHVYVQGIVRQGRDQPRAPAPRSACALSGTLDGSSICTSATTGTSVHGRSCSCERGCRQGERRPAPDVQHHGVHDGRPGRRLPARAVRLADRHGTLPTTTPCGPARPTLAGSGYLQLAAPTDWTAPNQYGDMSRRTWRLAASDALITAQPGQQRRGPGAVGRDRRGVPELQDGRWRQLNVTRRLHGARTPSRWSSAVVRSSTSATRSSSPERSRSTVAHQLLMRVDPNNAITLPELDESDLVR